jgi:Xaa-Pro aminopeptidase
MTGERMETRISDAELARRWQAVRDAMRERQLDALVMQGQNDWLGGYVRWFTDLPAQNGYPRSVVFFADAPMSVVEMGPAGAVRVPGPEEGLHRGVGRLLTTPAFLSIAYTHGDEAALVLDELRRHGCRRLGLVGAGGMAHGFASALHAAAGTETEDATLLVDAIKAIKSAEETGLIRRAAAMQDAAFAAVLAGLRPGMRDRDATALAWRAAQDGGSEQGITLASSAPPGFRASFLGRHLQGRRIAAGDHFTLLIEVNGPGGFYAEIARTVVLGRADAALLDGFAAMRAAQAHTLALLRPGTLCAAVAAAHDDWMRAHGLPAERRLYCHGQGYDMVERPLVRHDETMRLAAGMNLAVHPGYETDTLFAVICDNYLLGAEGPSDCLHRTDKRVFELG